MARTSSRGACRFCNKELTKSGLARHLHTCSGRKKAIAEAAEKSKADPQNVYHLQLEDAYTGIYWLQLEVSGTATLGRLDTYLRAIWLECCGHMRHFSAGDVWSSSKLGMSRSIDKVFAVTDTLNHIYDYGSSSETKLKLMSVRQGKPLSSHPIYLMARNAQPAEQCIDCEQPASFYCVECLIEHDTFGSLCKDHVAGHPHDDYGDPLPLVNSPRMGICGYTGPAEPPY